jgi:putative hydrolase of the HAD superfamily/pyrimidine and pyridine-specific 5'-nucleotidase
MAPGGVEHIFFDCDDTLYRNNWATASKLNARFAEYCSTNLDLPESKMLELYKKYGTTLCGLIKEGHLDEGQVPDFLNQVHNVTLDDIQPDPELRAMLLAIPHRRWVFTAATREHAYRCLWRLGIEDLFEGVIACSSTEVFQQAGYVSKHDPRCFEFAMDVAGVSREQAAKCMLLDDSASNLKTAKLMGWSTVLVGRHAKNGSMVDAQHADVAVNAIHEIQSALPELFGPCELLTPKAEDVNVAMEPEVHASGAKYLFFDCDDSLYRNSWATASKLNAQFAAYCSTNLGVPESKMMDLYKTHGTTLCGLIREGYLEEAQVSDFLSQVHDIALDDIQPDPELRAMLLEMPHRRWVFTAATREHAVRCLRRLGIEDCFLGVIACSTTEVFQKAGYVSKHDRRCFEVAMDVAGVPRDQAAKCTLLDDSASNLKTAKAMGWNTVLVGLHAKNGSLVDTQNADVAVNTIHDIQGTLPELFGPSPVVACPLEVIKETVEPAVASRNTVIDSVQHIFFDCDDSLYRNSWATASKLNAKFAAYCSANLGVPESKMMDLYKTHGTTLCGLIREGYLNEAQVSDFLSQVHDIALDDIQPDPKLRAMLLAIPQRRWVFTAATREHAVRCLRRLGIEDCFQGIIACSTTEVFQKAGYVSKHDPRCFEVAMDVAGVPRDQAAKCMLLDDSASNLKTAKAMGWSTVLVGLHAKNGSMVDTQNADAAVNTIHEIRHALPSLFVSPAVATSHKVQQPKELFQSEVCLKRNRRRELKPLASSPARKVLRRVSTPLSPRSSFALSQ